MRFNIFINQVKALEWDLNLQQAALMSYCYELASWANPVSSHNGVIFYHSAKSKIISELPILTDKQDTVYRILKSLEEKGLIRQQKNGTTDLIAVTQKGKLWNTEKNPSTEINPKEPGNFSEKSPEIFPTDNNTNTDNNTIDKGGEAGKRKKSPEEKIQDDRIQFCKWITGFVKNNPGKYPKKLYVEFTKYWIEATPNGKKLRFQDQKFFEIGRRLATWFSLANNKNLIGPMLEIENSTPALDRQLFILLKETYGFSKPE